MSNIRTYSNTNTPVATTSHANSISTTEKIEKFATYLHQFLPVLEREFNDLERLNQKYNNEIFPIKMRALSDIYKAAGPLYEWYVTRKRK